MSNIIAIYATIMMCLNGEVSGDVCSDGKPREEIVVSILSGNSSCLEAKGSCFESATWDSVVRIERNGKMLFDWRADGSATQDPSFTPNKAAEAFLQAVEEALKLRGVKLK